MTSAQNPRSNRPAAARFKQLFGRDPDAQYPARFRSAPQAWSSGYRAGFAAPSLDGSPGCDPCGNAPQTPTTGPVRPDWSLKVS
jgi:hypothetical protein